MKKKRRSDGATPTEARRSSAAILVVLLCAASAMAQQPAEPPPKKKEKPPSASLSIPVLQARSAAPMPVEIKIEYDGEKVYRGPLSIVVRQDRVELARITTPEIVVTRGTYVQRYLLPAVSSPLDAVEDPAASLSLSTADGVIDLGVHRLDVARPVERSMVLGIVDVWQSGSGGSGGGGGRNSTLIKSAMLDRFKPSKREAGLSVKPAAIAPGDMPVEPISLCAYDAVLIPPDGLAELDAKQLAALGQWLRGGGAVCIVLGGQIKADHAAFLNAAVGESSGLRFALDAQGRPRLEHGELEGGAGFWRCGVGRLVIAMDVPDEAYYESPRWAEAIARLWAVRQDQVSRLANDLGWDVSKESKSSFRLYHADPEFVEYETVAAQTGELQYGPLPTTHGSNLPTLLSPKSVNVVPFGLVVALLALFALAVGPGDWLLLGLVRQRKLTWLLFPATALAFTLLIVVIADRTMGAGDLERSLVVSEVDALGTVLRRSTLDLLYPNRHRLLVHDLEHRWMTRMDRYAFEPPQDAKAGGVVEAADRIVRVDGRMPTRWRLTHRVLKRTPWLNRTTTIAPAEADTAVHVPWGRLLELVRRGAASAEAIDAAMAPATPGGGRFAGAVLLYEPPGSARVLAGSLKPDAMGFASKLGDLGPLLDDLCARPREGLFTVVSQIAPTGSDNLEDLSLLDASDQGQRLLVVVEPRGDRLMVWRHLFTFDGAMR